MEEDQGEEEIASVLARQKDLMRLDSAVRFPGPQPTALSRHALHKDVKSGRREYWLSEKIDGVRKQVFMTRYNTKPVAYALDRKGCMSLVYYDYFHPALFDGTVLDAEFSNDKFVVFDCPVFCGQAISHRDYGVRLKYARDAVRACFPSPQCADSAGAPGLAEFEFERDLWHPDCVFEVKPMFLLKDAKRFCEKYMTRADPRHRCDGVILNPVPDAMYCGKHPFLFKFKETKDHTCDFRVRLKNAPAEVSFCPIAQPGNLYLYFLGESGREELYTSIRYDDVRIDGDPGPGDGEIWECALDAESRWLPIRQRSDKKDPNAKSTVLETLQCIADQLTLRELYEEPCLPRAF